MLAGRARAVALVERAGVPVVGARGSGPDEAVGGAARARARACLRDIALSGRSSAYGARISGWVLARAARTVALIERAGIPVAGAGRSRRSLRVRRTARAHAVADLVRI